MRIRNETCPSQECMYERPPKTRCRPFRTSGPVIIRTPSPLPGQGPELKKQTIMIPILQATPIAPESSSGNLFYLFLVFCIIVVAINVSRLIKRHQRRGYYQGNSATTSNESDVNPEEYGYTTEQGETLFDDVKPEDDEVEYKIIGTNHRDLSKKDIGYSENFYLKATKEVKEDKYAVEIYNGRGRLAGYLDRDLNRFWHKLLMKANPENPVMQCRGFIGQFRNDRDELKFYGKVYLPEVDETDPDYKRIMNG